ncbi:MAG TPA: class I SAM-dependent methyltransferase [Phycisphaerae bacterium]|nr:class I SAM-dependent methyltransferase [Phycisphaerae bacterium]
MKGLAKHQDAMGQAMYDYFRGHGGYEIVERDDGFAGPSGGGKIYLAPYEVWSVHQQRTIRLARGRVLDVGCGAGRVALHLQSKGHDVVGIDNSPLAIKACRLRGVKQAKLMSVTQVSQRLGMFDAIVMYGNNFGLFGSFARARWLLRRFRRMTNPGARIIAESRDPYDTTEPCHLAYHRLNRRRGRMAGQLRIRIRYKTLATPWFDYLLASKNEIRAIVDGTGWRVDRFIEAKGPGYAAVIARV